MNPKQLLQHGLEQQLFLGYAIEVKLKGQVVLRQAAGYAAQFPKPAPIILGALGILGAPGESVESGEQDTIFDLASLTKGFCTTVLTLRLQQAGKLELHAPISDYLPGIEPESGQRTIHQLLCHTAGLPAVPNIYQKFPNATAVDAKQATEYLLQIAPVRGAGEDVIYSCTGFLLLGLILQRLSGKSISDLFGELRQQYGLAEIWHTPPPELAHRCATTEFCHWRNTWIQGVVHDENAYCMAGNSGNAGLFASLDGLSQYIQALFNPQSGLLSRQSLALMQSVQTGKLPEQRSYGLALYNGREAALRPPESPHARLSRQTFGHTGFTGTSVYIDPQRQLQVIFLTNRLHYGRETSVRRGFLHFRPRLHDAIVDTFCQPLDFLQNCDQ